MNYMVFISIRLMTSRMHHVKCVFDKCVGTNLIRKYFLKAESLRALHANNRPALKNETNEKARVVETITLHFRIIDSKVRVAISVVHSLEVQSF